MAQQPRPVELTTGEGGLGMLRVTGRWSTAEVYLHGAHVTAWAPHGRPPVLWMSRRSRFDADSAIRGGVPVCFPWFGGHPQDATAPSHGFARLRDWSLLDVHETDDDVVVVLGLDDDEATRRSPWPHPFQARYSVTVGRALRLELEVVNRGTDVVTHEAALHTYLAVGDVRDTVVLGLEGSPYVDRLAGEQTVAGDAGPVTFSAETDRIYLGTSAPVRVDDVFGDRTITVSKDGSAATVVWNPWSAKAAAMSDVGDDGWTGMVCVETANVRTAAVRLAPGQSHTMTAVLEEQSGSAAHDGSLTP